ncbi:MAG: hypothetical protein IJO74_04000 [Clostridia bacterium]|nr:hypothetical protein [Clostridia bacterium]
MTYQPPLYNAVKDYAENTISRFHMPGHGGRGDMGFLSGVSKYDLTELKETDNLADARGVISEAQELAARKFSSDAVLFSCMGATLCIQGALYAAMKIKPNSKVYCCRQVHKSVINAFSLMDVEPEWLSELSDRDFSDGGILIYTHTDYYGNIADLELIKKIKQNNDIIIIADNSHGSHLAFFEDGKLHPTRHGVDFSVDSLHKTLPVLTGGACLNLKDKLYSRLCREGMTLFGSTSPNYLIMASVDRAISQVSESVLLKTRDAIEKFKSELPQFFDNNHQKYRDPFRMVLKCANPEELYDVLYDNSVKCEFYDDNGVVLIVPYGADVGYFEPLKNVLKKYNPGEYHSLSIPSYNIPEKKLSIRSAVFSESIDVPLLESGGKVSAREYSLYPPGIPIIVPGEVFDENIIAKLSGVYDTVKIIKES